MKWLQFMKFVCSNFDHFLQNCNDSASYQVFELNFSMQRYGLPSFFLAPQTQHYHFILIYQFELN